MTIEDVEFIQELERRITAFEGSFTGKVDLLTILLLVFAISLFIGSIFLMLILFNFIKDNG